MITKCQCSKRKLWNSWRWSIEVINSVDNTNLPCYIIRPVYKEIKLDGVIVNNGNVELLGELLYTNLRCVSRCKEPFSFAFAWNKDIHSLKVKTKQHSVGYTVHSLTLGVKNYHAVWSSGWGWYGEACCRRKWLTTNELETALKCNIENPYFLCWTARLLELISSSILSCWKKGKKWKVKYNHYENIVVAKCSWCELFYKLTVAENAWMEWVQLIVCLPRLVSKPTNKETKKNECFTNELDNKLVDNFGLWVTVWDNIHHWPATS